MPNEGEDTGYHLEHPRLSQQLPWQQREMVTKGFVDEKEALEEY